MLVFGFILFFWILFFILNFEWGEFGSKYWYYFCFFMLLFYIFIVGYVYSVKISGSVNFVSIYFFIFELEEEFIEYEVFNLLEWKYKIIVFFVE